MVYKLDNTATDAKPMVILSQRQLDQLDTVMEQRFLDQLSAFLKQRLPDATGPELMKRLQDCCQRARRYGIHSPRALAQFACLSLLAGPDFDEIPEVRAYLSMTDIRPEERLRALVDVLEDLDRDWNATTGSATP